LRVACLIAALLALAGCALPAEAPPPPRAAATGESTHEGYYYPPVGSSEVYRARARVLDDSDRQRRLGFVVLMLAQQLDLPYPPQYMLFAKGDEAEKMIVVGFGESFATLYRARAVMAGLTALARETPLFRDAAVDDLFTFYDLARLLGFREIVLSDGETYAHRIALE